MAEFDLLSSITVGQYLPGRSFLHRMDPRAKMLALFALTASASSVDSYIGSLLFMLLVCALVPLAGISLRYTLSGLRAAMLFIVLLFVFQLLFSGNYDETGSPVLFQWISPVALGPLHPQFTITETSLRRTLLIWPKLVDYWVLVSLLTFTTATTGLTHGVESLLRPFRFLRVPAHDIAMMLTIALRFVPTLAIETEHIMKAQAARGADFGRPGAFRWLQSARQLVPILVPLFVTTFRRAEELIVAMESRCYVGGHGRTRLIEFTMKPTDWALLAAAFVLAGAFIAVRFPS